ncbi:MAG: DUF4340 domain-containing protein, partial [Planctomycetes bacterium]|nr:DUF4340 domain-containing protein [Planctomycetota bacterium]
DQYVLDPRPEADEIVRVEFERRDQPRLVFERSEKVDEPERMDDWRMVEPLASATESYQVDGLARLLSGLQYQRSFKPGVDEVGLADAGLEPPVATLKLTDKDGNEYAAQIGRKVALSNNMYVRVVGSEEIVVVARDLSHDIEREVNDYRAKRLLNLTAADARNIHIEHEGKTSDFTRGEDNQWVINQPVKAYALNDKVRALVEALGRVRVEEFIEDAPSALDSYGLDTPILKITVMTEKTEEVTPEPEEREEPTTQPTTPQFKTVVGKYALHVGGFADLKSTMRYVKLPDQPWVASVTQSQLDKLFPKLSELRDASVTRIKADDVTKFELTQEGVTIALEKKDGQWEGTGDLAELETEAVKALLRTFEDVNAIDYVDEPRDLAQYGLEQPRAILTATTSGSVEPVSLRIGADTPSGHNTYVQVTGQTSVMVISAQRATELVVKPIALRSRAVTSFTPGQIKRVSIRHGEKSYELELKPGGRTWRMLEPADAPPNPSAMRELVNDLSRLRAKQVVARDDDAAYGLDAPALTIEFDVEQPPVGPPPTSQESELELESVTHTLRVGRQADKTYARYDDVPYVFELDQTVYNVFTAEFIKPGLFDIKSENVTYLRIEAPGGTVEFEHDGEQWTYPPDKFLQLSQKKVGDFVKELGELRVSAYMAYRGGDLAAYGLADAPVTVTLRLKDESTITLKVDQVRAGELPRKAAWVEQRRVFLLRQAETEKLMRGLDYYVKPDAATDEAEEAEDKESPRPRLPRRP